MGLSLAVADAGSGLSWLYLTVFLLVAADAILPLIPGETALIAAGALASGAGSELSGGRPSLFLLIAAAAVGAWLGDNLAYSLGWRAGPYAVVRLLGARRGPALYLKADRALATRGAAVLIAARFVPGARTATTIAAGVVGYPRRRFRWTIAVADTCWAVYVGLLGYLGGRTFEDNLLAGVAAGLGAALVFALGLEMVRLLRRHRATARGSSAPAADRPADLARIGDPSGAAADHELVQQLLAGPGHRVDGGIEYSRVVRSGRPKAGDLPDVLEGSGPDVVVGDRLGERRAQGLDTAAHAAQSAPAVVVRQNQHRAGSAHHLPCG